MDDHNESIDMEENGKLATFPLEILLEIFANTDDIDLLNLSETCRRFQVIAQMAFQMRYANDCFTFYGELMGGDHELYAAQMNRFGGYLKEIQLNGIENIDTEHWILKLLHGHTNRINKLTLNACTFVSNDFLSQSMSNITHLTFYADIFNSAVNEDSLVTIDLPECGNLMRFDYRGRQCISTVSLERLIRQNPALQSLLLYDFLDENTTLDQIITFIDGNLNQLRELALVDEWFGEWHPLSHDASDGIVNSFGHLESLAISVDSNAMPLLQRFGTTCTGIKQLTLHPAEVNCQLIDVVCSSFQHMEHLHLFQYDSSAGVYAGFLRLLCKCQTLQTITYHINLDVQQMTLVIERYYEEFIETINITRKPNAIIEVKCNGEKIIAMSKNQAAWADGYKWIQRLIKIQY